MRAISLVNKLELDISGILMKNAVTLGDVDNDKGNELIVGNIAGDVVIFKGLQNKPWRSCSDLGMITAVEVGDILNEGMNFLVTLSGEGWCNIFEVKKDNIHGDESPVERDERKKLTALHTQRLPANIKIALLADIDGDGNIELVLGLTDRVVRSYRWIHGSSGANGKLVAQNKWEFASQIGSVSPNTNADGSLSLLVAQPGGTFVRLHCNSTSLSDDTKSEQSNDMSTVPIEPEYHPLTSTRMRNPNISAEVLGNISQGENEVATLFAVATLDGTLMLVKNETYLWSLQVDHQLICLSKLDVTGDGREEVIASSWDGQTYIVNHERQSVRFQFEESVCSFTAGMYSLTPGLNTPCLVYATFSNRICVYYDVYLPQIPTFSLTDVMEHRPKAQELLSCLQTETSHVHQVQQLYDWCLYGMPNKANHV